jgi:hypothetical protein
VLSALARVDTLREQQHRLRRSLEATVLAVESADVPPLDPVHAHLRHRPLPMAATPVSRSRLIRVWASASASLLFAGFGRVVLSSRSDVLGLSLVVVAVMLLIEAVVRGRLLALLLTVAMLALGLVAAIAAVSLVAGNVRTGVGILLLLAAAFMAVQTTVDALRRR